ncbi:MAG: hypothetical protein PHR61_05015 [Candidatus Absconditabacteria bacterium]|nr:hypothetical protein [Candidatus Absconditabacteria bacterium]
MFFLLALIVLVACVLYFYFLGLWFLALIPLIFLIGGFAYVAIKTPISFSKFELSKYSLHIAWVIVLLAIFGILSFLNINFPSSLLYMLVGNFLFWILSYFFNYDDGKKIFQFGYYLILLLFVFIGLFVFNGSELNSFIVMLLSLQLGFIGFLKFILGIFVDIEDTFLYTLFVSGLLLFCVLIVSWFSSLSAGLSLISVILTGLYLGLRWFVQKKPVNHGRISVRRILAGERVTNKTFFSNEFLSKMYDFVVDMPQIFRYIIEILNVLVVVILFVSFVANWSNMSGVNHLFYWIVISFFVGNVLLLKRIEYTSFFQNLFLFFVIHFAVYVSLFSYFESNIKSIVLWSVVWNIITSLGLFVLPEKYKDFFDHKDYWYWIVASIMSFLVNVFLLLKSGLAGELVFFLLLLYVGIESMLVFYGIKHISNRFQDNS